ncbi:hypothetical protein L1049_013138 [Liquidambar formosana]|uniref:TF-B3 domain-containing protein n=1 Tax=Liquidambar formosana TaxID=63359 RepID=A0AAP0WTU4_LIQFO
MAAFDLNSYPWAIRKQLTASDVNGSSRLLLPTESVEDHVLTYFDQLRIAEIESKRGARVVVRDVDTNSEHHLTFKRWPSTNSYVLINNWKHDFVRRKNLRQGDEILLLWNRSESAFYFSALLHHAAAI